MSKTAEEFLKGLSEHSKIFEINTECEYTEEQLILFAEMYHKSELNRSSLTRVSKTK